MITICVVDDQKLLLQAIELIVAENKEISCLGTFSNAESFMEEFEYLRPDITLMDIDLPGISGIEAIAKLKAEYPRSKFLVLTVFNDEERVFKALKAGASGYLLKKHSFDKLLDSVTELHYGGAPMSPEIASKVINHFQKHKWHAKLNKLTEKENIVLEKIVNGLLYKEIADEMGVTIDAIKKHAHNIYEKLHVRTRSEAIKKYLS